MRVVHSFDTKISSVMGSKMIGNPLFPIFFGVELEYEVSTTEEEMQGGSSSRWAAKERAGKILNPKISEFAFLKHDGSLNNGFEIVTLPMSIEEHFEKWDRFFSFVEKTKCPISVSNKCGMHVHVSRDVLSHLQIGKIIAMIYSSKNKEFLELIAGRPLNNSYTKILPITIKDTARQMSRLSHDDRYCAFNLVNSQSVEFRIFAGTMEKERVFANLEFCDAMIKFTWPGRYGVKEIVDFGVPLFKKFIAERRKKYPNLYKLLKNKKEKSKRCVTDLF